MIDAFEATDPTSPAISLAGTELWFGSRGADSSTEIWLTAGEGDIWSEPKKVDALNSDSDDAPRQPAVQGGTIMPLSSKRGGSEHYQIWFATRASTGEPWQAPTQDGLGTINSPAFESADAFLTADGLTLLFSSTRSGKGDLFRARRSTMREQFGEPEALPGGINTVASDERDPWLHEAAGKLYFSSSRSGLYEIYVVDYPP
jgi:hypothetical protein